MKFNENPYSVAELFHAYRITDRQTDMTRLKVAFCKVASDPEKGYGTCDGRTRQPMYINHYCNGKAINITYIEFVRVALGTKHTMRMIHTVICGLSRSTVAFHIIS